MIFNETSNDTLNQSPTPYSFTFPPTTMAPTSSPTDDFLEVIGKCVFWILLGIVLMCVLDCLCPYIGRLFERCYCESQCCSDCCDRCDRCDHYDQENVEPVEERSGYIEPDDEGESQMQQVIYDYTN